MTGTCLVCHGSGEREITVGGSGDPEADVIVGCDACLGTGHTLTGDLYQTLCTVAGFHNAAVAVGQSGLGAALATMVNKTLAKAEGA